MKTFKKVLNRPATAVLLFAAILALVGVIVQVTGNIVAVNIPINATKVAQAQITQTQPVAGETQSNSGNSISIGGDANNSTIIQSDGGDVIINAPTSSVDRKLDGVAIEGDEKKALVAFNAKGEPIWRKNYETPIAAVRMGDVNGNGRPEVFIGFDTPGEKSGFLLAYDDTGALLGEINTWKPSIYQGGAEPIGRIVDFTITDLANDGDKELVVISDDVYWYASKISVFTFDGKLFVVKNEYWNPGLLYTLTIVDLDYDKIPEIIVTGVNNDLQAAFPLPGNVTIAFLFEGNRISGQAPPWFGNAERGSELWYGFVTPREVRIDRIFLDDIDRDGVNDIHLSFADNCSIYINKQGQILGQGHGTACKDESQFNIVK